MLSISTVTFQRVDYRIFEKHPRNSEAAKNISRIFHNSGSSIWYSYTTINAFIENINFLIAISIVHKICYHWRVLKLFFVFKTITRIIKIIITFIGHPRFSHT